MFDAVKAMELAGYEVVNILCGHYEGVDQRVLDHLIDEEISIGDYVLTGGELPAMVLMDCIMRYVPGVLSNDESLSEESFSGGLLEYPQYTRPFSFQGWRCRKCFFPDIIKILPPGRGTGPSENHSCVGRSFLKTPN